ncbi:hypothetical protein HDU67_007396 [Dinochytrium kinnereticum]|nr:hypothetical protein HDU67_007396 [Dinochytrium kinnereticum]
MPHRRAFSIEKSRHSSPPPPPPLHPPHEAVIHLAQHTNRWSTDDDDDEDRSVFWRPFNIPDEPIGPGVPDPLFPPLPVPEEMPVVPDPQPVVIVSTAFDEVSSQTTGVEVVTSQTTSVEVVTSQTTGVEVVSSQTTGEVVATDVVTTTSTTTSIATEGGGSSSSLTVTESQPFPKTTAFIGIIVAVFAITVAAIAILAFLWARRRAQGKPLPVIKPRRQSSLENIGIHAPPKPDSSLGGATTATTQLLGGIPPSRPPPEIVAPQGSEEDVNRNITVRTDGSGHSWATGASYFNFNVHPFWSGEAKEGGEEDRQHLNPSQPPLQGDGEESVGVATEVLVNRDLPSLPPSSSSDEVPTSTYEIPPPSSSSTYEITPPSTIEKTPFPATLVLPSFTPLATPTGTPISSSAIYEELPVDRVIVVSPSAMTFEGTPVGADLEELPVAPPRGDASRGTSVASSAVTVGRENTFGDGGVKEPVIDER